jgi:hypothetical protein
MRTYNEYRRILVEWEDCGNVHEVERRTGIPLTTVHRYIQRYQTVENFEREFEFVPKFPAIDQLKSVSQEYLPTQFHYAYVLGIYLGDGHISKTKAHRAHRIMIFLDMKYPKIIERCVESLETVFPGNKVGIVNKIGCVSVNCYSQELPILFPQDGSGKKHDRPIILEDWQQRIVDTFPLEFFRGLYHSDGSRPQNIVKGKNYPRYQFSNESDDIRKLFTDTVEKLGLSWTTANRRNVAISRREDVEWLDKYVGAKA